VECKVLVFQATVAKRRTFAGQCDTIPEAATVGLPCVLLKNYVRKGVCVRGFAWAKWIDRNDKVREVRD
jgi:hypothetical protein